MILSMQKLKGAGSVTGVAFKKNGNIEHNIVQEYFLSSTGKK
jgi:hypothetical protein